MDPAGSKCLLTGTTGIILRRRTGQELIADYARYFGLEIPLEFQTRHFESDQLEYFSPESGLRWFHPQDCAGPEFYEFLGKSLWWYYQAESWDKRLALKWLTERRVESVVEVGCGDGTFLRLAAAAGVNGVGIDTNESSMQQGREAGLALLTPGEFERAKQPATDTLCLFQTLEHVPDPHAFLARYLNLVSPRHVLISVPSWETIEGYTRDPLIWPPHHQSLWSEKALRVLGRQLGYHLARAAYEPLSFDDFKSFARQEPIDPFPCFGFGLRASMAGSSDRVLRFKFRLGRLFGLPWATRRHSILVQLNRS